MARPEPGPLVHSALDLRSPADRRDTAGLELSHLGRYVLVGAVLAGCLMVSAWSRIDLRSTAVALDETERALAAAQADRARLSLELATLREPARLRSQAAELGLTESAAVVDLSQDASN